MSALRIRVQETVSRQNLTYTFRCDSIYDMLLKLKQRFSPSDESRERDLIARYHKVRKAPKDRNIEDWLEDLEKTIDDCTA